MKPQPYSVLFACDQLACDICSPDCHLTSDPEHAINFEKFDTTKLPVTYFEKDPFNECEISEILKAANTAYEDIKTRQILDKIVETGTLPPFGLVIWYNVDTDTIGHIKVRRELMPKNTPIVWIDRPPKGYFKVNYEQFKEFSYDWTDPTFSS